MEHFNFQSQSDMLKNLDQINDKEKNNKLVNVINSGLKDLKEEIKKMSEEERETEKSKSQITQKKSFKRFLDLIKKNKQDKT